MTKTNFDRAKFVNSNLRNANIVGSTFRQTELENIAAENLILQSGTLSGAILIGVNSKELAARYDSDNVKYYDDRASYSDNSLSRSVEDSYVPPKVAPQPLPAIKPETKGGKRYDVYYGTNRKATIERGITIDYGSEIDDKVSYGLYEVFVPDGRPMGKLGSSIIRRIFGAQRNNIELLDLIVLDCETLFQHVGSIRTKVRRPETPVIVVHGYNTTFRDAVIHAAQLGYDLGLGQGIGMFSWASNGRKRSYFSDECAVEQSKYDLAEFILRYLQGVPSSHIDVIGHSMGCRCVLGALEVLAGSAEGISALKKVNQVIFAAADVDAGLMPKVGAHVVNYAKRTTSYVSGKDKALKLSRWLHGYSRVGISPPPFVMAGMDTIIVNDMELGPVAHGYLNSSRTILSDVFQLLKHGHPPDCRHGLRRLPNPMSLWQIKE